jgi:hypothetical protein
MGRGSDGDLVSPFGVALRDDNLKDHEKKLSFKRCTYLTRSQSFIPWWGSNATWLGGS